MKLSFWSKMNLKKKKYAPILIVLLFMAGGIVLASSTDNCYVQPPTATGHQPCFQVANNNQSSPTVVDEWTHCYNVTNTTAGGLKVFIPTANSGEWQSVWSPTLPLPVGLTLNACQTQTPIGPFSASYQDPCGIPDDNISLSASEKQSENLIANQVSSSGGDPLIVAAAIDLLDPIGVGLIWQSGSTFHTVVHNGYTFTYNTSFSFEDNCSQGPARYFTAIDNFQSQ